MRREELAIVLAIVTVPAAAFGAAPDMHSYAQPERVRVKNVDLDLTVRFEQKVMDGIATLSVERAADAREMPLVLDTRDLSIEAVWASSDGKVFEPARFVLGARDAILGAPLTIDAPGAAQVRIKYAAGATATGLQWLEPAQTAGKKHPYLFTQSQAIHARSWIPLQDSPGIRITYTASVHVPAPLSAVMSAEGNRQDSSTVGTAAGWREFSFRMDKPIPAYLLALAVGDLSFRPLGPRSGVYAEPTVAERAAKELEDIEPMMRAAEDLYGPYRWGRYDLLILPPSFAWGGMENPMLTFASPTILAGDKSLVAVMTHELAHSWSGNLVTNATAADFWLNEGFTVYVERRVLEKIYGPGRAAMEAVLGRQELERDLAKLEDRDKILHIDLAGRDPDDAATSVPYEKGSLFLTHLEHTFGRERVDTFLRGYFRHFAFQSITTQQFRDYLEKNLLSLDKTLATKVPVEPWIESATVPESAPRVASDAFLKVDEQAGLWLQGKSSDATLQVAVQAWSYHEWHHFLRSLPAEIGVGALARLDALFRFTASGNAEIASEWLRICIRNDYAPAYPRLEDFLTSVGRRKLILPLYEELAKSPEGLARGKAIYAKARPFYQLPVASGVDKALAPKP